MPMAGRASLMIRGVGLPMGRLPQRLLGRQFLTVESRCCVIVSKRMSSMKIWFYGEKLVQYCTTARILSDDIKMQFSCAWRALRSGLGIYKLPLIGDTIRSLSVIL